MFKALDEAYVIFDVGDVRVTFPQTTVDGALELGISCRQSDWQLSSLAQVCSSSFPQAPMVECLYIEPEIWDVHWQDDIENSQWLELLHPFTAVKDLYISWGCTPRIAPALQELSGERVTEVLPALRRLFPGRYPSGYLRHVQEGIEQFVSARQLAGYPIAVSRWER
jgi:hypothetical protein